MTGNTITWLGHATFKVVTGGGKTILIDPWVGGNPACPEREKVLSAVDLMLITHTHDDHVHDAIEIMQAFQPTIVSAPEAGRWLTSHGAEKVKGMNKGGTQVFDDVKITMVSADHSCGLVDDGVPGYGGEPVGYVVELEDGFTFYHAGDTNVFGDMALIGELYSPDLALLPIGGHFTMGPVEAAKAVQLLKVPRVIGMHFGTMPILAGTPEQLRERLGDAAGVEIIALEPGESITTK